MKSWMKRRRKWEKHTQIITPTNIIKCFFLDWARNNCRALYDSSQGETWRVRHYNVRHNRRFISDERRVVQSTACSNSVSSKLLVSLPLAQLPFLFKPFDKYRFIPLRRMKIDWCWYNERALSPRCRSKSESTCRFHVSLLLKCSWNQWNKSLLSRGIDIAIIIFFVSNRLTIRQAPECETPLRTSIIV